MFHLSLSATPTIIVTMQQGWTFKIWRWVDNFTPGPFYCHGRGPQFPLNVPQNQSGHFGAKLNFLTLHRFEPNIISLIASSLGWPLRRETLVGTWCVFVRALLHMRTEEKPTRCHWMFYCFYDTLNMFRALVCPSSGARDYMFITACGVRCWTGEFI